MSIRMGHRILNVGMKEISGYIYDVHYFVLLLSTITVGEGVDMFCNDKKKNAPPA